MIYTILQFITIFSVLLPIWAASVNYKHLSVPLKTIYYFLIISACIDVTGTALAYMHMHNLFLLHVYTAFEFVALSLYARALKIFSSTLIDTLIVLFLTACLLNYIFFEKAEDFNAYTRSAEALIIIIYTLRYFNLELKQQTAVNWGANPLPWFNAGLLIYFASAFTLFIFSNVLLHSVPYSVQTVLWEVHNLINVLMYILFYIGYKKCKASSTTSIYLLD